MLGQMREHIRRNITSMLHMHLGSLVLGFQLVHLDMVVVHCHLEAGEVALQVAVVEVHFQVQVVGHRTRPMNQCRSLNIIM
jgi:hypothetical protein